MPSKSKDQQKLFGMVHAAQQGAKPASPKIAQIAKTISPKDAKDFASTSTKNLPKKVSKKDELVKKLREYIRKQIVKEINTTSDVEGYGTPYAFSKPGMEKKKGEKQAKLTGYSVVKEAFRVGDKVQARVGGGKLITGTYAGKKKDVDGNDVHAIKHDGKTTLHPKIEKIYEKLNRKQLAETLNLVANIKKLTLLTENRWLDIKREDSPVKAKIGNGISAINKQLSEVERFLNWYGRLKQESGISGGDFWKRTNNNIYRIKERLIKLEQHIRKFV
jgi:hypothetical protein